VVSNHEFLSSNTPEEGGGRERGKGEEEGISM
jgi:hypothetical protein